MVAPAYQFIANGLYEVIWGISVSANVVARQGYVEPFFQSNVPTGDPLGHKTVLLVTHADDFRLPTVTSLDARVEKKFVFGFSKVAVDFDVFNLLTRGQCSASSTDARLTGPHWLRSGARDHEPTHRASGRPLHLLELDRPRRSVRKRNGHCPRLSQTQRFAPEVPEFWIGLIRRIKSPVPQQCAIDLQRLLFRPRSGRMTPTIGRITTWLAAIAIALATASTASAQVFTGRIDVTLEDSSGGRLPGVSVDLSGPLTQTQVSDAQGQAHFLNLPVGTYAIKAALSGFNTYTNGKVEVVSGASTPIAARLAVAGTTETVNVTAATPIIDLKRDTTTTNVTLDELQNIPSSRDPWAVMQTVPTVYMDRVNVGGAESGQQSNYNAKGANDKDNTWSIDGVPITDMGATGSSAFYYDFDSFQEMAVTTGGADASNATGGVQLNMVLRKGNNKPSGDARIYFENDSLQSVNISPELAAALGNTSGKGNRTDQYKDYGFDLGGPLLKDRVWVWGTIARTNINLLTLTGDSDKTEFKNYAFKADGKINQSIRGNFTFYENNKIKEGRSVGPTRPPETAWNQTGPTKYFKGEGNFVVGSRLFATAKVAHVDGGFVLAPVGGLGTDYYIDDGGVTHNTFYQYQSDRPQDYVSGDGSYFAGKHEVKFGGAWRSTPVTTQQIWPASHLIATWDTYPNMFVQIARDYAAVTTAKYMNGFVTDTISLDRLTIIGGLRFDHQESSLGNASVPGVPGIPILPALNAPAVPGVFKWNNVTPRVGITYAVDEARKTVIRASYAMFASQLPGDEAKFVSPIQYSVRVLQRGRSQRRRYRAAQRAQARRRTAGLHRLRPDQPEPAVDRQHGRSQRQGADHARVPGRHGQGDPAELLDQRHRHLPQDGGHDLGSADRREALRLHADRHALGQHRRGRPLQRSALCAEGVGGAAGRRVHRNQPAGLPPAVSGSRARRHQAHVESLDGAVRLLDQRLARILR